MVSDNVLVCIGQSGVGGWVYWAELGGWLGVLGRVGWVVSDNVLGCIGQSGVWVVSDNVLGCIGQNGVGGWVYWAEWGGWLVITSWAVLGRVGWVVGCIGQSGVGG